MPDNIIITVDGQKQNDIERDLVEAVVDTNVYLPAMFSITVNDEFDESSGKLAYTDTDALKVGAEVKIEIETDEIPDEPFEVKATLIIGEITAIEPAFGDDGVPLLCVRGFDRSHRLTRGKKTRTFGDANPTGSGVTDEQIIQTIVRETDGITSAEVDTSGLSGVKYYYVLQNNQSDFEFLWARAKLLGYQVYVEDKTLQFRKADSERGDQSSAPATLLWPLNLSTFEPRQSVMHQVQQAVAIGWDPATKKSIESIKKADSSSLIPKIGLNIKGSAQSKQAFKDVVQDVVVDHPLTMVDEAAVIAQSRFTAAESVFVQAEGVCRQGDPRLIAGRSVTIEGVGERFSGAYYVTEAQHVYSGGMYSVSFSVTGRQPNTVSHLVVGDDRSDRGTICGVVIGKVTNLEDPEKLGRVQVLFPWLPKYKDADLSSNWARLASPMAGSERGMLFVPEIDDEVLVAFEHGDPSHPYVVGALWNAKDKPPEGTAEVLAGDKKKVNQRILRSRSGHLIILDDTEGAEQIIIQDKTEKNSIVIGSKENTMTILADGDLAIKAGGKVTITSGGDLLLDSGAKGTVKTMSDMSLEATGNNKVSGAQVSVEGKAKTEVKAPQVSVSGDAQVEVKSGGMTQIQGSLVKIN